MQRVALAVGEGRESNDERSSEMRMASYMLNLTFRLIGSAPSQKAEAKPVGNHRERSQGGPAMGRRDVAGLPSAAGLHIGRVQGRASPFRAKSVFSTSFRRILSAIHAVTGASMAPVVQAIMSCTRKVPQTDEVLRRLVPLGRVTAGYKPYAKGQPHAPVMGTGSPRPHLQGWQQRRSRGASSGFDQWTLFERQNLRVPCGSDAHMGRVSLTAQATQWPGGTSSRQPVGLLRNCPQQHGQHTRRFIHIRRNQHGIVSHC